MLKRTYVTLPYLGPSQATIKLLKQIHQKISTIFHEENHVQDPGSVTRMIKILGTNTNKTINDQSNLALQDQACVSGYSLRSVSYL